MKAIKLQRSNKLHHYWLSQYIKAIVLHQREFEFEFWPIRKFHFIQPGPVPSTILNYCPIRWLLFHLASWILFQSRAELPSWIIVQSEDCFPSAILNFWPIRDALPPPNPPPLWHRTLTFTLLASKASDAEGLNLYRRIKFAKFYLHNFLLSASNDPWEAPIFPTPCAKPEKLHPKHLWKVTVTITQYTINIFGFKGCGQKESKYSPFPHQLRVFSRYVS